MSRRAWSGLAAAAVLMLAAAIALVAWLNVRGEDAIEAGPGAVRPDQAERGAYLARVGNCMACHTERGGRPYAGGAGIDTPFGSVYASNLTPDDATGLGTWSPADFWRALHHGRSKDGRLLAPVFPYPNYTQVTRADSDAIYAFLRTQPAVAQANKPHALRWPYNTQAALAVWRALFFRPAVFEPEPQHPPDWNRGAYLVRGLGHCVACHATRNALGATTGPVELGGGLIPMQNWYAPSLASPAEAGMADWAIEDIVQLLQTGRSARGSVLGPMADVVFRSTQYLSADDLRAMAVFLKQLPQVAPDPAPPGARDPAVLGLGAQVYKDHCARCHGDTGQGRGEAAPALAGNRAVTLASPANLVRVVVSGGYLPATAGNPRPFGMPPFGHTLNDAEIAAVTTFIRQSWGHQAAPVSPLQVLKMR